MWCAAGIQALKPPSQTFADIGTVLDHLLKLWCWRRRLDPRIPSSKPFVATYESWGQANCIGFISHIERYGDAFAELHRLGVIAISLPVSTASCERSFLASRHIKTWVRNSMSNEKLDCVSLLAIERERTQSIDTDKIVDAFAAIHNNRRIALKYTSIYSYLLLYTSIRLNFISVWKFVQSDKV